MTTFISDISGCCFRVCLYTFGMKKCWKRLGIPLESLSESTLGRSEHQIKGFGRILVEIDIHTGLLETLEIVWCGYYLSQTLDYLGIPFRCTRCRKTGHLWWDCVGILEEEVSEGTLLERSTRVDFPDVESSRISPRGYDSADFSLSEPTDSIMGKLKSVCPTLYYSLSSWERNVLDESSYFGVRKDPMIIPDDSRAPSVPRVPSGVPTGALPSGGLVGRGSQPRVSTDSWMVSGPPVEVVLTDVNSERSVPGAMGLPGRDPIRPTVSVEDCILPGFREPELGDNDIGDVLESLIPSIERCIPRFIYLLIGGGLFTIDQILLGVQGFWAHLRRPLGNISCGLRVWEWIFLL
jgi:hypothetical protein